MITKRLVRAASVVAAISVACPAAATPSSVFWTPATSDTQPALVPHLTYDTHFGEGGALQIDTGVTLGVLETRRVAIEVGADLYHPTLTARGQLGTLDFAQVNAKATLRLSGDAAGPAISVGVSNVGFKADVSNYDVVYAVVGLPSRAGRFALGAYHGAGSEYLWSRMADAGGRNGLLLSWVSPQVNVGARGLDGIRFLVDVAAGKNWFGGAGAAVELRFTPAIGLKTGPVVFADWDLYQNAGLPIWLWSVQLDVDVDLRPRQTAAPPEG